MRHIALAGLISVVAVAAFCPVRAADEAAKPATVEKPKTVTREEWGSEPKPLPDSAKHTPKFVTIHHGGTEWKTGRDPAKYVKS